MFKKLFFFALAIVCLAVFINMTNQNQDRQNIRVGFKTVEDVVVGDYPHPVYQGPPIPYDMSVTHQEFQNAMYTISISEVSTAARTYYDLQSNGCIKYCYQDPTNLRRIHACFMVDPVGASGFPDRRARYFFSNDTGNTWTSLGQVPNGIRAGFPGISGFSDGSAVIACHTTDGGTDLRGQFYKDAAPGAGSFTKCDPGLGASEQTIWVHFVPTTNITLTPKLVFAASVQASGNAYTNAWLTFSPACGFQGYLARPDMESANQYQFARADNGNIGCAYIGKLPNMGMVYFMESTNNGVTFGAPTTVFTPNYSGDSLGALRSVDVAYLGNTPKVVFGVVKLDNAGNYFPFSTTKIYCWQGSGSPVLIDSAGPMNGTNTNNVSGVMVGVCRPVIGKSSDNNAIYVAYNKARNDTDAAGNNFFDVYFNYSVNGGAAWSTTTRQQVTNLSGPLRDCQYVSISSGANHVAGTFHFAHLIFQSDSVPSSFVNGAGQSLARMMYGRIKTNDPIGIHNINGEVPKEYVLHQNYPNPFNPSTTIRFELPKNSFVSLRLYNALGEQIAVLINENLNAGTIQYEYNASNLPSGVYFYKLEAGNFTDTKKMVLLK